MSKANYLLSENISQGNEKLEKGDRSKPNRVNVIISLSYSNDSVTYDNLIPKLINHNPILLNDLIEDLIENKNCKNLIDSAISYYDTELTNFIYCGIYPFDVSVAIPFHQEDKTVQTIRLRSRILIKKENLMRMDLKEEANAENDDNNQNVFINQKSKRSKERKIGYIIEKVFLWRKLYNDFTDDKGNLMKLTLEEAADKVGISKKSLDDYLIQLRIGKQHGFPFNEHKNDKVGVLRAYVKKHKSIDDQKYHLSGQAYTHGISGDTNHQNRLNNKL